MNTLHIPTAIICSCFWGIIIVILFALGAYIQSTRKE